ncbi:MAG: T9SS type A sorting domain-containing protein, partial [Chitinophagales bacterium]
KGPTKQLYKDDTQVWYYNEGQTLSAGSYNRIENEYTTLLPLGNHRLYFEITDLQNNCTFPIKAKLNVAENPTMEVLTEDVDCFGGSTGSISVTANGGSNEYDFLWNDEELTGNLLENLPADIYEIIVMDAQSHCSVSQDIVLTQPDIISTNFEQLQWATAPPMENNKFSLEILGGVAPYQYELTTESEEEGVEISELANNELEIEASPFAPWSLQISDANDCTYQFDLGAEGDDDINLPFIETAIIVNETDLGQGDGDIEITITGGDDSCGGYIYSWSSGENSSHLDYLTAGEYEVIITDCVGNTTTAYINLERDGEDGTNRKAMKIFPNPAVDWTKLRMVSEDVDEVLVRLFDTNKQLIQTIFEGELEGEVVYEMNLDLRALPSGVYYVQLTTPSGINIAERIMTIK